MDQDQPHFRIISIVSMLYVKRIQKDLFDENRSGRIVFLCHKQLGVIQNTVLDAY
ncbi:hypothetical protein EV1_044499 [Malus domestica]